MRPRLLLSLPFLVGAAACDAAFIDLRDEIPVPTAPASIDAGVPSAGDLDAGADPGQDTVVAAGPWRGRSDYRASGAATLIQRADGRFEVRFSEDFSVSGVPGPVVVLSRRAAIGGAIDPAQGDLELGPQAQPGGAQTYDLPAGADDRRYVWIYCKPFGIEVARARLEDR